MPPLKQNKMKHTIEALQQLKEKIQFEHYTLLCDALIKDTDEEIAKLKAQLPAKATNSPAPCDRKKIWQNVAIKCDTQEHQEHLAQMAYLDGILKGEFFEPFNCRMYPYVYVDLTNELDNASFCSEWCKEYDYPDFITHYNANQCKGQ